MRFGSAIATTGMARTSSKLELADELLGQLDDGRFGEWHPRRQRLQLREDRVERRAAGVERELHQRRRLLAEARGGLAAGGLVRPDGHLEQVEAAARRLRGGSG